LELEIRPPILISTESNAQQSEQKPSIAKTGLQGVESEKKKAIGMNIDKSAQ